MSLETELNQFIGTEAYHRWSPLFPDVLTDGAKYLAEKAQCYWLMDMIISHLRAGKKKYKDTFAVANLKVNPDKTAKFTLDDGNDNIFATQHIEHTTFPLPEIKLYVGWQERFWVILVPSEY